MAYPYLQIEGDPTTWVLSEPIDASVLTSQEPLQVAIVAALHGTETLGRYGTLILSSRAAASAVLSGSGNVIPSGGHQYSSAYLYLPSATGLRPDTPGHALPPGTDPEALQSEITAAMSQSEFCTISSSNGVLVLNGATLPFIVLFPAITPIPSNAIPSGRLSVGAASAATTYSGNVGRRSHCGCRKPRLPSATR
jgi:hypothetical protein